MDSNGVSNTKTDEPASLGVGLPIIQNVSLPVAGQTGVLVPSSSGQPTLVKPRESLFKPGIISKILSYFSKKKYDEKIKAMEKTGDEVDFPEWLKLMAISKVNNNTIMSGKFYTLLWAAINVAIANLYLLLIQDGIISTSKWVHSAINHSLVSLAAIFTTCFFSWEHGRYSDSLTKYFTENGITVYSSGTGDILIIRKFDRDEKVQYQRLYMP